MYSLYEKWRFATEVAGVPEIAIGRGENMEITTYLGKSMGLNFQPTLLICASRCLPLSLMLLRLDLGN